MGNKWFEVVNVDHFWVKRRFIVLLALAESSLRSASVIGEIGCGNGLVQRQIECYFEKSVDGYDLNTIALKNNISQRSRIIRYDITNDESEIKDIYDLLLLMDVLEHIGDQRKFLFAANKMLKSGGFLIVNVPAFNKLYSDYDRAVGHIRRYDSDELTQTIEACGFKRISYSYWGLPLIPLLWIRRLIIRNRDQNATIRQGMSPGSNLMNRLLGVLSNFEILPNHCYGTSLMAVFKKKVA